MTVFLALILSLLTALVIGCLSSVQMACARVQISEGAQTGLYSLFAQYDSALFEEFQLFYLDGGFQNGKLNMGKVYDTVVEYMEPVLEQNYQNLEIKSGGITGYRLATDNGGASFRTQAAAYMRETLGIRGVQLLLEKAENQSRDVQNQQEEKDAAQIGGTMEDYDRVLEEAQSAEATPEISEEVPEEGGVGEAGNAEEETAEQIENPIDTIRQIQKMGILELVLPNPGEVSMKTTDWTQLLSNRELQQGMGVFTGTVPEDSAAEQLLFREYILDSVANYRNPSSDGILSYPLEYIIGGDASDMENLKSVVHRLLLIREGVNFVYLLSDSGKMAQAAGLATAISSALLIPMAEGLVQTVLLSCWAYAESILDVRELMSGGKIPLMKSAESWQLGLENLGELLTRLDTDRKEVKSGMDYKDYLRVLLYLDDTKAQTMKCMDAFELTVRGKEGHEAFCMDSCIDALEIAVDVEANSRKTYEVIQSYQYYL